MNIIWQTIKSSENGILSDPTNGQYEYLTKVLFKNIEYTKYFDNEYSAHAPDCKTFLDNSIIIYACDTPELSNQMKGYLQKYKELNLKYILFHIGNESLNHNCDYYADAAYVFRFYYDNKIVGNVKTLPLGFVTGYMNEGGINLSDKRDIDISFIGQGTKNERPSLINAITTIDNKFLHLTRTWNCLTVMTVDKVIEIYKRTLFVPCPIGSVHPDTLRLFEALEWGCIPILRKYKGEDYFKNIFGEHPIPIVDEWTEIPSLIKELKPYADVLINSINGWYKNFMDLTVMEVTRIVNETFIL